MASNLGDQAMAWVLKYYECSVCGTKWTDEWSCACNDRCPECWTETEPYDDKDLTYLVEHRTDGFVVMFSSDSAESSPDYVPIGIFRDQREALALIKVRQEA